jgi:Tfp pilus assembly protein FimV
VYRRRRLAVVFAALTVLALPAAAFLASGSPATTIPAASAPAAPSPARTVYVVQPGDTLWSIAHKLEPTADPREVVDRLVDLNGSAALQPGQRLRLTSN